MQVEYILSAHGIGGSGNKPVPPIENFRGVSNADGTEIRLTWLNSDFSEFTRTEIFMDDQDISNISYEELSKSGNKIVNGIVPSFTVKEVKHGQPKFFKAFQIFTVYGEEKNSSGVSLQVVPKDTVAPGNITNMNVRSGDKAIILSWKNPSDRDFERTIIRVGTSNIGSINDGEQMYSGTGTNATYAVKEKNKTHYIRAFTKDINGNVNSSTAMQFTADTSSQPTPSKPSISGLEFDRATVTGGNNTEVKLDSGTWYSSPKTFTGLTEKTSYTAYARVKATDTHFASPQSTGTTFTTPPEVFLYGVKIDENNSNPQTAVTYIEDCVGFTPANGINQNWGSWKSFVDEYLSTYVTLNLSTRQETQQIDPNNWTKTTSGGTAVLDGSKGDLMWKVPKLYWKFERKGTDLYIYLSEKKLDSEFVCLAHTKGASERDYIYYSVMLGTEKSGKLRSIDGGTPTNDKTIEDFRSLCEANGTDVHMLPYYPWLLYQIIVLILGKNRNTQAQWGNNQNNAITNVAKNLSKGMIFGQSAKGSGVNAFIADPWGNQYFWIDGMKYGSIYNILVGTTNFNNDAKGYESVGKTSSLSWGGINKVHGTSKSGFVPTSTNGSTSTHYADEGNVVSGYFPVAGGHAGRGFVAGAFCWYSYSDSSLDSNLSARIFAYGK